jgi:SAM-dependent methyltransferase
VTQALRRHVRTDGCRVIAVDNSAAMVERCREYLNGQDSMFQELLPVEVIEGDILALDFQPASVVALNFTLQFIAPEQRTALLSRIRQSLLPGGALILSEKLRFNDRRARAAHRPACRVQTRQRLQRTGNRPEAQRHRKRHEARQPRRTPRTPAGRRVLESRAVVPVS